MRIRFNGEDMDVKEGISLAWLARDLKIKPQHVLLELNGTIQAPGNWKMVHLKDKDRLELLSFVGGG